MKTTWIAFGSLHNEANGTYVLASEAIALEPGSVTGAGDKATTVYLRGGECVQVQGSTGRVMEILLDALGGKP